MVRSDERNVLLLSIIGLLFLIFLYIINPPTKSAIFVYILFAGFTTLVYLAVITRALADTFVGFTFKNFWKVSLYTLVFGAIYWLVVQFVPGFSIGYPVLPNAVSDSLKFFIIVFIAPIFEELAFRGSLLGAVRNFEPVRRHPYLSIIIVAFLFSLFHLVAYSGQIYNLPGFSAVLTSISSNLSAFISAFLFGCLAGFFAIKFDNLLVPMLLHGMINFIIYTRPFFIGG